LTPARALITGAAGFVGARLAERLTAAGIHAELLVRPGSDAWRLSSLRDEAPIHEVDLRDSAAVARAVRRSRAEAIFHLAAHGAYSWQEDPWAILETNLLGTLNLLQAGAATGFAAFVHAGSSSEYGFKNHAPSEGEALVPNSYYAVAKAASTMLGRYLAEQQGLNVTTLRLSSVYGPWEEPRRLVPTLIASGTKGRLPPLVSPDIARDFVHVDDVCDAFTAVASASRLPCPVYNIGSGSQTTMREIVELARTQFAIAQEPEWGTHEPRGWDASVWVSDPRRALKEFGWHARIGLSDGFAQTVGWLRDRTELWTRYGIQRFPSSIE
jgi:nucleoside-diphosphate-sugar epimerase